ncbi:TauD/TfdA family dioxygenase [Streptomyces sp. NPDC051704]|uniref:TauD/TfdA family dioxygenase n=1 Tax=Streptomyces sp. NPDC051704 TaxID=3365671 RepID=UPI003795E3AD
MRGAGEGTTGVRLWPAEGAERPGEPPRAVRFASGGSSGTLLHRVQELTGGKARLIRDVTIGMPGDTDIELVAEHGDFWFHTDAAFLPVPPRWMAIAVLEADGGGGLDLLPVEHIDPEPLAARASYLTVEGVQVAPILEQLPDGQGPLLRYRRDRMIAVDDTAAVEAAHRAVEAAADQVVTVGELAPGEVLLVDNWTMLHRRRPFNGRRVIRRLWFDAIA